jgi:hypothetical protein
MSIIGMTASPEAFLAREAEICYACMAHVTDYDVWHHAEEPVTVERVVRTLNQNTALAQQAIAQLVAALASGARPDPGRGPGAPKAPNRQVRALTRGPAVRLGRNRLASEIE